MWFIWTDSLCAVVYPSLCIGLSWKGGFTDWPKWIVQEVKETVGRAVEVLELCLQLWALFASALFQSQTGFLRVAPWWPLVALSLYHLCSSWSHRHKENLSNWLGLSCKSTTLSWSSKSISTQTKWTEQEFFFFFLAWVWKLGGGNIISQWDRQTLYAHYASKHKYFSSSIMINTSMRNFQVFKHQEWASYKWEILKTASSWPNEQRWQRIFQKWHSGKNRNKRTGYHFEPEFDSLLS